MRIAANAKVPMVTALSLCAAASAFSPVAANAGSSCATIAAQTLQIAAIDCGTVWPVLRATGAFPDVFAGAGKQTNICYMSTGSAAATIGGKPVKISSVVSGWTTDFVPMLFGGTSNIGTVVTRVTIIGLHGNSAAELYTRDTVDLSQIATTGMASEEDVIVGGGAYLTNAKGTYQAQSVPEDATASMVALTNLAGELCLNGAWLGHP
jgi:hypothetical protein